jgi:hypothetical protein
MPSSFFLLALSFLLGVGKLAIARCIGPPEYYYSVDRGVTLDKTGAVETDPTQTFVRSSTLAKAERPSRTQEGLL